MFANATLHPAYGRVFFLLKSPVDQAAKEPLLDAACANINKLWEEVEARLNETPWLAGQNITMADILMTVIANWSARMPKPITLGPKTRKLLQAVIARPAYKKALETEGVEYKVAA
jgi:glutathione S-transferase